MSLDHLPDVVWHEPRCVGAYPGAVFFSQVAPPFVRKFIATRSNLTSEAVSIGVRCCYCKRIKDSWTGPAELPPTPHGKIKNSRWLFDPDAGHFCDSYWPKERLTDIQRSKVLVDDICRRMYHQVKDHPNDNLSSADVYTDILATINLEYPDEAQHLIENGMPSKDTIRNTLNKHILQSKKGNKKSKHKDDENAFILQNGQAAIAYNPSYEGTPTNGNISMDGTVTNGGPSQHETLTTPPHNPFSAMPPHSGSLSQTPIINNPQIDNQPINKSPLNVTAIQPRTFHVTSTLVRATKRRMEKQRFLTSGTGHLAKKPTFVRHLPKNNVNGERCQPSTSTSTTDKHNGHVNAPPSPKEPPPNSEHTKLKQDLEIQLARSQLYESQLRAYKLETELSMEHRVDLPELNSQMKMSQTVTPEAGQAVLSQITIPPTSAEKEEF